ncbi:MAG: transglutaminase-like domain-containing protein [Nevskiales bacterium]
MNSVAGEFLHPTPVVDADHAAVRQFAERHKGSSENQRDQAVALYYAVRDGFRYNPYALDLTPRGLSASRVLEVGHGWCVTKAVLLAAACRAAGIPARLGYADVRNHLSTERMRQTMQTDIFYWHGYTSILLEGQWLKATPAFNIELCEKFRLKPLEFNGTQDSIYHPFDLQGNRHMEYLNFRGEFADVPVDDMRETFVKHYPQSDQFGTADFDKDVAREIV